MRGSSWCVPWAVFSSLLAAAWAQCEVLSRERCAQICVPSDGEDFSCGDWANKEVCCNGTTTQTIVEVERSNCYCMTTGLRPAAISVILIGVLIAVGSAATVTFFVIRKRTLRKKRIEEEKLKAIEEAHNYLPR